MNQVIMKSIELAKYDKRFKQMEVKTELSPTLPLLALDTDKMQQVFFNLLLNARDAIAETGRTGEISIQTERRDGSVIAEVTDNGPGIPTGILNAIFDPFFTTKTKGNGTGLGLAVCQSIVTAHGGRITAENRSEGAGSTFRITFPISRTTVDVKA